MLKYIDTFLTYHLDRPCLHSNTVVALLRVRAMVVVKFVVMLVLVVVLMVVVVTGR